MNHFDSNLFYQDMDTVRHGWGISWQQAARESLVSISTIDRIKDGGGFHVESLMLLAEFFELWDLKRYATRKGEDERTADRSEAV